MRTTTGAVKCWGDNSAGQLGDGTHCGDLGPCGSKPVDVVGLASGVTTVAVGEYFACALMDMGTVKCWGHNDSGELGNGTLTDTATPVDVKSASGVSGISAGGESACAVMSSGSVSCWGDNEAGQLGEGAKGKDAFGLPVPLQGLSGPATAVSIGFTAACAQTSASVECWGENINGELGDGSMNDSLQPVSAEGLANIASLAVGPNSACVVTAAGEVECWGADFGDGTMVPSTVPTLVPGLESGAIDVSVGMWSACVVTSGGAVKCWGTNMAGQLGDGTTNDSATPVDVVDLASGVVSVRVGIAYACALLATGGVKCWGDNSFGQLGDGTMISSTTPVDVVF